MLPTNMTIEQGMPFRFRLHVSQKDEAGNKTPYPLTGCRVILQARANPVDRRALVDLGTYNYIEVDEEAGSFFVNVPPEVTARYDFDRAMYQCEIHPSEGDPVRVLRGILRLDREVVKRG